MHPPVKRKCTAQAAVIDEINRSAMSRPTIEGSEKLSAVLPPIRCTEDEKTLIRARSNQSGLSMSEYVRQMALMGKIVVKESSFNPELIGQLRKLGVNLNQQTKKLNSTGVMPIELVTLWRKLETVIDDLMEKD